MPLYFVEMHMLVVILWCYMLESCFSVHEAGIPLSGFLTWLIGYIICVSVRL